MQPLMQRYLIASGVPVDEARGQAIELFDALNIADQANKFPSQLSGGQQQRSNSKSFGAQA